MNFKSLPALLPCPAQFGGIKSDTSANLPTPLATMHQVHGAEVRYVTQAGEYSRCDALITDIPNLWLSVKTADCVPILIHTPRAVAAIHCGWKGLQQELLPKVIRILKEDFLANNNDFSIAIGPHISSHSYEVGEEFRDHFPPRFFEEHAGKLCLNLAAIVTEQITQADLPLAHVSFSDICTLKNSKYYSYRANKTKKRNMALIQLAN